VRIASTPEDFIVDEVPAYAPSGEGEHTFVRIEKRGLTTEQAVRQLARAAGTRPREVGYAGRKDRVAVARQWLSVPGLDPERALEIDTGGLRVLEAFRHRHKLRTGQLRGNRFELVVRDVAPDRVERASEALSELSDRGMPNRFGAQRFGREGDNAERGRDLLRGGRPPRDRRAARFLLSALQAEVFNTFLAARPLPLDVLEEGEVAWIHASGAAFVVEDAQQEAARVSAFEISPSGPIFGSKLLEPRGAALERERAALAACGVPDGPPPKGIRLAGARRSLRVRPEDAHCEVLGPDVVRVCFGLPPGSYATVLVEELLG